eukprot:m.245861 g.245861  ORF g.245861 m.245861 type:complete len:351 (+) comp26411_c0_seq1:1370-2422(+)
MTHIFISVSVTMLCEMFMAMLLAVGVIGAPSAWPYSCTAGDNITASHHTLGGQVWVITGANGRLGYQVTSAALRNGARVIAMSIDSSTAAANCEKLAGDLPHPNVKCVGLDLSSFTAVKGVAAAIAAETKVVDVLVNVAATMGRMNVTKDGIVETMEVNVVSPALLTSLLKPQMMAARKPRVVFVGSANCYDPLDWPATDLVESAVKWTTGVEPHPGTSQYYFYSFSKFVLAQYAAELAKQEPGLTTFTVNPGFFRDDPDKYRDQCHPQLLFTPCPQYPDQGATSTFFTAAQPGIEAYSGSLIDFDTKMMNGSPFWVQSGDTCVPRALPPAWTDTDRAQWYGAIQKMIAA